MKKRLDILLVEHGLCRRRSEARALIMAGRVLVDDQKVSKAGTLVEEGRALRLLQPPSQFVSRGGDKLEGALDDLDLDVSGLVALDVGASTGGFTDCLLQRGARQVIALDVGYGQLAWSLRNDPRVTVIERTNIRHFDPAALGTTVELATIDVSFISLTLVLPVVVRCLAPGGRVLALVKPQFEAGRDNVGKGGVVRDPEVIAACIEKVSSCAADLGFAMRAVVPSRLKGPKGNQEHFLLLERSGRDVDGCRDQPCRPLALDRRLSAGAGRRSTYLMGVALSAALPSLT